ncbi:hypothetical protein J7E79_10380 [Bacillus sp. ISL-40]|nr:MULTISPECIES: hypothetical protein [unclassified Bacillus (in: firmicutes)]MBT2697817.1 hypothetical protein [Bacillus sp. ISL-40]MBT2721594.1 hypothetical protein [Bacillus sp. ISL-46]
MAYKPRFETGELLILRIISSAPERTHCLSFTTTSIHEKIRYAALQTN